MAELGIACHRCVRQTDPQLRLSRGLACASARLARRRSSSTSSSRSSVSGCRRRCGHVGQQPADMRPSGVTSGPASSASVSSAALISSAVDAWQDADRTEMMLMQGFGESTQDRLAGIGGDAVDDQLMTRDAKGERRPALQEPRRQFGEPQRRPARATGGRADRWRASGARSRTPRERSSARATGRHV